MGVGANSVDLENYVNEKSEEENKKEKTEEQNTPENSAAE
jgi:hypothetical protein